MEIEAGELKQKIDRGDDVYILDVRTPQEYQHGRSPTINTEIRL